MNTRFLALLLLVPVLIIAPGAGAALAQSGCAATLSQDLAIHVPNLAFGGSSFFVTLQYVPSSDGAVRLTVAGAGPASSAGCSLPATLTGNQGTFAMNIPALAVGTQAFWANLVYTPTSDGLVWFMVTGAGQVNSGIVDCGASGATAPLAATILAPNGTTPVAGATVTLGTGVCTGLTGAEGNIEFLNAPVGSYTLSAQKGIFSLSAPVQVGQTGGAGTLRFSGSSARLAVIPGSFDTIEAVLTRLGFTYQTITADHLRDAGVLGQYDYLFLNCGLDDSPAFEPDVLTNLRNFVGSGKRLYASDFAFTYVENAFPQAIDFFSPFPETIDGEAALMGAEQVVTATILDVGLATVLGRNTMSVTFDLPGWAVMDTVGPGTEVLIRGTVSTLVGSPPPDRPLSVAFTSGSGRVVFTSFHNEAQTTADMDRILEHLIMQ